MKFASSTILNKSLNVRTLILFVRVEVSWDWLII